MNRVFLLFLIVTLCCSCGKRKIETLQKAMDILYEYPDSALKLFKSVPKAHWYSMNKFHAYYDLANIEIGYKNGLNIQSDSVLDISFFYFEKRINKYAKEAAKAYYLLGCYYSDIGDSEFAMSYLIKAQNLARELNMPLIIRRINMRLSLLYYSQFNYDEAVSLINENITIYNDAKSSVHNGKDYQFLGYFYTALENYESAIHNLRISDSIAIAENDSVLHASNIDYLIIAYSSSNDIESAKELIPTFKHIHRNNLNRTHQFVLSGYYLALGMTDSAKYYIQPSLDYANRSNDITYKAGVISRLREIAKAKGDIYEALDLAKKQILLQDTIYDKNLKNSLRDIREKYNYSFATGKITELSLKNRTLQLSLLASLIFIFVIAALLRYVYLKNRKEKAKTKAIIASLNTENSQLQKKFEQQTKYIADSNYFLKMFIEKLFTVRSEYISIVEKYKLFPEKLVNMIDKYVSKDRLTENDWIMLRNGVDIAYNNMATYIKESYPKITIDDLDFICLTAIGCKPADIAFMKNLAISSVYSKRVKLCSKFHDMSDFDKLDDIIDHLCHQLEVKSYNNK